jgi:hypothetical protein
MGLLAPLFLAGLLAVAIPIVVHLVHRERKEPLGFPSLMFLRRVPFRSAKRQRIRYWLLFLMRTAALILIAAAFARPWVKRDAAPGAAARGGKDIVVLVDRSYSMSAREVWQSAQRAAADAVASAGANDRVAVIGFGERAELLARLDEARAHAQAAVQSIEPGSEVTRFAPAFKLASSALASSRGPAEIVVVTDRQRSGWRNLEQVPVPPNTTVRVVDVSSTDGRNLAITNVQLSRSTFAGRQRIVPTARLINRGDQDAQVAISLRLNERVQQTRNVDVAAHGTAEVRFDAMFASSVVGEIRIDSDDDVAIDNTVFFTTASGDLPAVRVVSGSSDASFYFENALAAGNSGTFALHRSTQQLNSADLQNTDVVVLLEAPLPSGDAGERLEEFVRQGGSVIVASTGATRAHALSPLRSTDDVRRDNNPASIVSIDELHPVFEPFRASGAAQFASAGITRYQRGEALPGVQVAARFDDGAPALLEQRLGRGRVLYWASGFTRAAGDFVLQPAFVPFVQQLVRHAVSNAASQQSFTVGQVVDVNTFAPSDRDAVVLTPAGERIRLAAADRSRSLRVGEAGIYQVRGTGEGATTQTFAANIDPAESDLTPIGVDVFQDAITARGQHESSALAPLGPRDRESQQSIWWYLLLIAFAFLAVETFLGNRISTAWRT